MATYYSDMFADLVRDPTGATIKAGAELPDNGLLQGHPKVALIPYSVKGNETISDVIRVMPLKKGTRVLARKSGIYTEVDPGGGFSVTVGDDDALAPSPLVDADADRYSTALSLATAAYDPFTGGVAETTIYEVQSDCWLTITPTVVSTLGDTGLIRLEVWYLEPF